MKRLLAILALVALPLWAQEPDSAFFLVDMSLGPDSLPRNEAAVAFYKIVEDHSPEYIRGILWPSGDTTTLYGMNPLLVQRKLKLEKIEKDIFGKRIKYRKSKSTEVADSLLPDILNSRRYKVQGDSLVDKRKDGQ